MPQGRDTSDTFATLERGPRYRVLHVIDALEPGGAERVLVDLSNALAKAGHAVTVCCTRRSGPLAADLSSRIVVDVLERRRRWDLSALRRFARIVSGRRIDLVHSHLRHTMQFVALTKVARIVNVPHVFHDHYGATHIDDTAPFDVRVPVRLGVDAYVGVDKALCEWARGKLALADDRVFLLRNAIDASRFATSVRLDLRTELGFNENDFIFVMVANLRSQKDHENLVRALALLPEFPYIAVVVAGIVDAEPGIYDRCVALARSLGVEDRIRFLGPRSDIPALLGSCDAGLLSSASESGPVALLEYMAAGLPYVVTGVGELTQLVATFNAGFSVTPRDPNALAAAMVRLARLSRHDLDEMGQRGRRGATTLTHTQQAAALLSIYQKVLP